ncbi:MAG: hypothetical protein ACRC3B_18490, partial [Bacteroidia bacterium]
FFSALTFFALPILILVAPMIVLVSLALIISGIVDMIRKERGTLTSEKAFKTFLTLFLSAIWTGFVATVIWLVFLFVSILGLIFGAS